MSILEHRNYRDFLKSHLSEMVSANPHYSRRAMALKLRLAPSYLSAILNGKKNISQETAASIGSRLRMASKEIEYFCLLAQLESAKNIALKQTLLDRIQEVNPLIQFVDLSVDHFRIISGWHHFAIMASTELDDFTAGPEELAQALGISRNETELALDRLERLGLLERLPGRRYKKRCANPRVVSKAPNRALRNFHRQTLQKATESLEGQSPQEKVVGSETFCIDKSQIEEFRELTEEFFSKALALKNRARKKTDVYHLGVQFFRLTQRKSA